MPVLSCGIMFMSSRGPFLHRHVKVAGLQNRFTESLLEVLPFNNGDCFYSSFFLFLFCLPVATKLLLPQQFQGAVL